MQPACRSGGPRLPTPGARAQTVATTTLTSGALRANTQRSAMKKLTALMNATARVLAMNRLQSADLDQGRRQDDVGADRSDACRRMEIATRRLAQLTSDAAIPPGPAFVPAEVVEDRDFDGDGGCGDERPTGGGEKRERRDLKRESERTHRHERSDPGAHAAPVDIAEIVRAGSGSAA